MLILLRAEAVYAMGMGPNRSIIDKVVYTASLASNQSEIDTQLDTLRIITATSGGRELTAEQTTKLEELQTWLEEYLVKRERLRLFTHESLAVQIDQYMQGHVNNKSRGLLFGVVGVSALLAFAAASLPLSGIPERVQAGGATAFSVITIGAAWLFLMALHAFQSSLRRAFRIICAGMILLGLSLLEQPIIEILELRDVSSLLYPLPILLAATLFHIGNARYVRLAGVQSVWTKAWPVIAVCGAASLITWFLPHPPATESELVFDLAAIIWACILVMPVTSAVILPMAARRLPDLYKMPIQRLAQAMIPIILVCVYQYVVRILAGPYMDGVVAYVMFGLIIIMSLGLLRAGYAFNKITRY